MDATTAVQKFRSKYPGAYDKYNDAELLSALQKKYPGAYNHLTVDQTPQHPENILQRSAKVIGSMANSAIQNAGIQGTMGVSVNPKFPFLPQMPTDNPALEAGMQEAEMPITNGNPIAQGAMSSASNLLAGGMLGGKAAVKGAKEAFPYTSKEARVQFTKDTADKLIHRRGALTRGYGRELDKSFAMVDLGDIEKGLGLPEIKGIHTLREAQELKNSLTNIIPEAIKNGTKISPKYLKAGEVADEITRRMIKAEPSMAGAMEKYGKHAENFKSAIAPIKGSRGPENIFGGSLLKQAFGVGGSLPEKSQVALKEFAPRVAESVRGAKTNENVFRGIRSGVISGAAYKFVPDILKRTFLQEVSK